MEFSKGVEKGVLLIYEEAYNLMEEQMQKLSERLHNHEVTIVDAMGSGLSFKAKSVHAGREVDLSFLSYGREFITEETEAIREIEEVMNRFFGGNWEFGVVSTYMNGRRKQ